MIALDSTKIALNVIRNYGFTITTGTGDYVKLAKQFGDDNLHVTLRGHKKFVEVYITGVGVKQERSVIYYMGGLEDESHRLIGRLKRLNYNAKHDVAIRLKKQQLNDKKYEKIRDLLLSLKVLSKTEKRTVHQLFGGSYAYLTINGYEIAVNSDMQTKITAGHEPKYVNIKQAIKIIQLMPTHVSETDI